LFLAVTFLLDESADIVIFYYQLRWAALAAMILNAQNNCQDFCCCNLVMDLYSQVGSWYDR
jgi:hypothetical protein